MNETNPAPTRPFAQVRMYTSAVCPYCMRAERLLAERGVEHIEKLRVDLNPALKTQMIQETGRRTVPQIYVGNTHVGGCDELLALDQAKGLLPLLQQTV